MIWEQKYFIDPNLNIRSRIIAAVRSPWGSGLDVTHISIDFWLFVVRGTAAFVITVTDDPFALQRWRTAGFSWWISPTVNSECHWQTSLFLMKEGTSASSTPIPRRKFIPLLQCLVRTQSMLVMNFASALCMGSGLDKAVEQGCDWGALPAQKEPQRSSDFW